MLAIRAPYHPDFPARAHAIGGEWDAKTKTWRFDTRNGDRVRALVREIFGTDGSPADEADLVTVRLGLDLGNTGRRDQVVYFAGRKIAERRSRDENVRLGAGVTLVSGGFWGTGGSTKYPAIEPKDGTVVEIRDLPRRAVESERGTYTIVDETLTEAVRVARLRAERERLLARLAEIDALLDAIGGSHLTTEMDDAHAAGSN